MTSLVPTIKLRVLPAIPPKDGRPVELQKTDTHIQWRYAAVPGAEATAWVNLVPLVDLIGPEGPSVEMRNNGTFIQWRVTGAPDWINLIAVADLIGPTGLPGADTGRFFRVRLVDVSGASPDTAYEAGDTIDGVTLVAGDYVLRATSGGNALDGVYVVPISGVASRHPAFAAFDDHPASYFTVSVGTAYANTLWRCMSPAGGTLGSTSITIIIAANYSPNNVVVDYRDGTGTNAPLTLSADPGSINNVTVIIEGYGPQPKNAFSLAGLQITPTGGAVWPVGTGNIEFCYGTAIAVNAPADASVTTQKIADANVTTAKIADVNVTTAKIASDAVTYAKMQNVSAQYRILGRKSSGAGDPEEVTASEVMDFISATRGVIIYRGASGWAALAPGTAGHLLSTNGAGADPSYVAPPSASPRAFKANKNATAQTSVATNTKVTFETEVFDQASEYDATNSRWTPAAGKHPVTAQLYYSTGLTDTAEYGVSIKKNGTTVVATGYARASGTTSCCVQVNDIIDANGTDYFEVFTYVGVGTPNVAGAITDSYFAGGKG